MRADERIDRVPQQAQPGRSGKQHRDDADREHARRYIGAGTSFDDRSLETALDRLWGLAAPDPRRARGDADIATPQLNARPGGS